MSVAEEVGGSWGPDDTIFFVPFNISGVWKVSASGGKPQEVTRLDRSKGEISHRWPQILPGGKAVLFTLMTGPGWEEYQIVAQVLETGERRVLVRGGGYTGRYVPTGHLVYTQAGTLMAVPFDLARLEASSGPPTPLAELVSDGGVKARSTHYRLTAHWPMWKPVPDGWNAGWSGWTAGEAWNPYRDRHDPI